jgi:hypothetical protein
MHNHDPLALGATRLFDQSIEIVRVAGEQHDGTSQFHRSGRDYRVDRTPVPRQTCDTKQFTSGSPMLGSHRHDHDPGQHAVH